MSDAATQTDDLTARRTATAIGWTKPENWDGDEWIGSTLPPWGTKPRCPAIRSGKRCRKPVIPGGTVCATHGGAAPQVKRRAKLRVLQLLDPALGQLARILANPDDQRIGLAAIKIVTDLNGMSTRGDVDSTLAKAILMDRHFALQEAARKAEAEALDGEIIEDAVEVSETGEERPGTTIALVMDDARTQDEIDDDDELLYDPQASKDFEAAEAAEFRARAAAELALPEPSEWDDDPGPDDEPIVTFVPHSTSTETDPRGTLS